MGADKYSLLALGDSYTIGESVLLTGSYAYQTVQLLRKEGYDFNAPEIIAKTGWTTDELQAAINKYNFKSQYDFVSLLIGVNNQYRGYNIEQYKTELEELILQAIQLAGGYKNHVIILSIPDWSVTPFAKERDRKQISREIDFYNEINESLSKKYGVHYINITGFTQEAETDESLIAADKLHPSAKEYTKWAKKIFAIITSELQP
jgi:lysophospholipase L1-like esterase